MNKDRYGFLSILTGMLLITMLLLPACGTLEVNIIPPTEVTVIPSTEEVPSATATSMPLPTPLPSPAESTHDLPDDSPNPTPLAWVHLPPGLFYNTFDALWLIDQNEQPVQVYNSAQAIPSSDGNLLLSYDAIQQDAWLIDRIDGTVMNLTNTPDRLECCFQWWPERPDLVLFGSAEASATDNPLAVRFLPAVVGIDGEGYQILDTEHVVNLSGAQGTIAPAPDGQTIAYGAGRYGYFYHHDDAGVEPFDPLAYGLDLEWPFQIGQPAWSPDGVHLAWIVKSGVSESGSSDWIGVVVFDLPARTARILYQYASQGVGWPPAPVWSPDGQWLAFLDSSPSENAGLWVAQIGGASETHHLGAGGNPVWSPDGHWLAFQSMPKEGGPPTYALTEIGGWSVALLAIPVDGYGQLVAWINLGNGTASSVTITGTVMDISLSARIITLEQPVDGVSTIALTEESVLLSTDGNGMELRDLQHGMTLKALGQLNDSGALIASRILVGDGEVFLPCGYFATLITGEIYFSGIP